MGVIVPRVVVLRVGMRRVVVFFQQAGQIIEFSIFPGLQPCFGVMAVVMTVLVIVGVTVGMLFSRGMLMRFPAMPVDINRTTHGEGQGSAERAPLEMKHVVILGELVLPVQSAGLESPASKAGG